MLQGRPAAGRCSDGRGPKSCLPATEEEDVVCHAIGQSARGSGIGRQVLMQEPRHGLGELAGRLLSPESKAVCAPSSLRERPPGPSVIFKSVLRPHQVSGES